MPAPMLREGVETPVIDRVREGLDMDEFLALQEMLHVTEEKLAGLLGMSRATLHRRKKAGRPDRGESDRLVRYARLLSHPASARSIGRMCDPRSERATAKWLKARSALGELLKLPRRQPRKET